VHAKLNAQPNAIMLRLGTLMVVLTGIVLATLRYLPPPHGLGRRPCPSLVGAGWRLTASVVAGRGNHVPKAPFKGVRLVVFDWDPPAGGYVGGGNRGGDRAHPGPHQCREVPIRLIPPFAPIHRLVCWLIHRLRANP
jgi:hypothetical protein